MATPLNYWSSDVVRAVIRFLNAKHVSPTEIHIQLVEVYGKNVMTKCSVFKWCKKFDEGRNSICDESRSGRPKSSTTDENILKIDGMIKEDRRLKIRTISTALGISKSRVYEIVHGKLGYHKICARFVPKQLTDAHKESLAYGFESCSSVPLPHGKESISG